MRRRTQALISGSSLMAALLLVSGTAFAQSSDPQSAPSPQDPSEDTGAASALQEEIVVTATKRVENVQDVPLAVTAFGERQLAALNFRDISSLGASIPNVQLEKAGTSAGFQNFSIRGLGLNSSIPSIDPTVGIFVDGIYQGVNAGVVFDNFDLEAIEVLRGPQGVLFGRNVTGGAVLLRTRRPTKDFEFRGRAGVETGPSYVIDASVSGPVAPTLSAKLAAYYTNDRGWFRNKLDGSKFGEAKQFIVRPALLWEPTDGVELLVRFEHGESNGDGPAGQNHALFGRRTFDFSINEPGFFDSKWNSASAEFNWDIGPGTLTNIAGWREYKSNNLTDVDSTPGTQLHLSLYTEQEQYSNELRYNAQLGPVNVTTGLYYFTQDLLYVEGRLLAGGAQSRTGGGAGTFDTYGAFAAVDWQLADSLTLNLGGRFTHEKKKVSIGTIRVGGGSVADRTFLPDFNSSAKWSDFSPKVGLQFKPSEATQAYASFTKGFRSGGFNFRNTLVGAEPGPFDSESQNAYEIGIKQRLPNRLGFINAAVFSNTISDIQREVQIPVVGVGIAQLLQNVGKVRVRGFEVEGQFSVTRDFVLGAQLGHTDGKYTELKIDLTGDNIINAADYALSLPRLSPWTYGIFGVLDAPLGDQFTSSTRVSFNYRDAARYTDNNVGFLNSVSTLDANMTLRMVDSPLEFSIYAKNITNQAIYSADNVLPDVAAFGGDGAGPRPIPTFSPLNKGRVVGVEVRIQL